MLKASRDHARRRTDREGSSAELRDARLQRKHPAIDARQRAAQAAVIGVKYGGGFRHRRTRAVTCLPRQHRCATLVRMTAISIHELHENTALWVSKATEQEPIVLTDKGQPVAKIVPLPVAKAENPFLTRKLLPGYEAIMHKRYGGQDTTEIISEMRDGR